MIVTVTDQAEPRGHRRDVLPPLAGEDYSCWTCEVSYPQISVKQAVEVIRQLPAAVQEAVLSVPTRCLRLRPTVEQWSVTEYVCHVRDVYATYTIRLHRARTEHAPVLEPMLNDLRALRFRYNERNATFVLDELAATAAGFCDEVALTRPDQWNRLVTRLPSENRTSRWLVRQAMHEGQHHLDDIRRTARAVETQA